MANTDPETYVAHRFPKMETTRYFRIIPTLYEGESCLRFELFGCDGGKLEAMKHLCTVCASNQTACHCVHVK